MSPKISVLVIIYRPGYIDSMTDALRNQTFKDFEWILVDDLWEQRKDILKEYVGDSLNLKHIPPREIKPYAAPSSALNTGFIHAEGELIYFMNDYMYPHPRVLERHWEIYSKYGPKVMISGPLIDAIVASGKSVVTGTPHMPLKIKNDEGNIMTYPEPTPPISLPLKDNFEEATPENLISILKEPFQPTWPKTFPPDWRIGAISKVSIDKNLYENDASDWFWGGRNDSAPLEALLDINGFDEAFDGRRGGNDGDLGGRLMKYGCRLLVDREAPCYMLPHPARKRANISDEARLKRVAEKRKVQPIPNDYSLRAERAKLGRGRAEEKKAESVSKILCISTAIYPLSPELRYGGIERLCFLISEELNRRGFKVSVAAPEGSSFAKGITHINTGPCGDFIEGERRAYWHYNHLLNESDAIISFDHRHFAMLERDLPAIALIWHTPSIMQFPLPLYNIASLSEFQKRELWQYQGLKSRVIDPHCVDPTAYLPQENDSGRYLFIGRLNPEKGVRDAIKLCRELGVGLDIIGGLAVGDSSEYLEWVESNCDPEQIVYHGNVSDKVKFDFIAKAKALLHTVNYPEVSSHKSIEALCGGLPVVAYLIGANHEIIEHGVTGFLASDGEDFKQLMLKVDNLDRGLIREKAIKRWSVEATVGRILSAVKKVAEGERWGNITRGTEIEQPFGVSQPKDPIIIRPAMPSAIGYLRYTLPEYPRQIRLDTINKCNAACLPCHYRFQKRRHGQMSMKLVEKILNEVKPWESPLEEIVPVNFGEFLLLENWYEVLKLIEEKLPQTRIALPTNGSLIDDDSTRKLASIRTLKWLNFSINAFFKETYQQFTGLSADTIDKIKTAVDLLHSLRPDIVICASMVFDTAFQTEAERDLFIKFWKPMVSVVSINPAAYCNSPLKSLLIPAKTACRSIFDGLTVLYDEKVVTGCCFDSNGLLEVGDANSETLLEIWRGEKLKQRCELHNEGRRAEIELCRECSFA